MSDSHKADGKSEHRARTSRILGRYASGGAVQQNAKSYEDGVKKVTGKSVKAQKPLFKAGGKASHARLDKKARGGPVKLKKGGKAANGPKINIVVAPHGQSGAAPGGLAGAGGPPPMPPRPMPPPMAGPPPGGAPMPGGPPPGMPPMRPPGMKSGGATKDVSNGGDPDNTQKGFYKRGGNRKAAGGSVSAYDQGKQEDLGGKSRDQESNEDVDVSPPKRKTGGGVIAGMAKGGSIRHTLRHPVTKRFMKGGSVKMDAGAGSGEGRLEKIKRYGAKQGTKH